LELGSNVFFLEDAEFQGYQFSNHTQREVVGKFKIAKANQGGVVERVAPSAKRKQEQRQYKERTLAVETGVKLFFP
jgi:hypothetical protein